MQEIDIRRNNNSNNVNETIKNLVYSVTEKIYIENEKMMKLKDNIYRLLDDTSIRIINK